MYHLATLSVAALAFVARTASASWAITGASSGIDSSTGARPFRLPLEELEQSGAQWDLYVQALQFWQSLDQTNMFSWYQIAGIHGLPNVPWDGQNNAEGGSTGFYTGYGTHTSVLFPTWHRPFCALYEEIISIYAHEIAETYPADQIDKYRQAADQLRIPYWDWSTNATIPDVFATPQLTINAAWGSETINNPMYRYDFHPYDATVLDDIYSQWNWTVRAGTTGGTPSNQALQQNQQQLHDGAYTLFSSVSDYNLFSNTNANDGGKGHQSLENIHNTIHNSVGGDMGYLWIAAMDPIFFLHHANVDRLYAMWQAIYPDAWIQNQQNNVGTFYTPPNTIENATWPLAPFHKDANGNMFDSDDVRDTKTFGYAYREVIDWNVTKEELSKNVITAVNQIYNPNGSGGVTSKRSHGKRFVDNKAATAANNQYVLNIVVDKSKTNGSMTMNFDINNHTVGSYPVLAGTNKQMDMSSHPNVAGQLALTHALLSIGCNLDDRNSTLSTIAKGMSWTAKTPDGTILQPSDLQDGAVSIQVATRQVTQTSPENEFPQYQDWTILAESVLGKFASQVLGMSEDTVKQVTEGITDSLEGIL